MLHAATPCRHCSLAAAHPSLAPASTSAPPTRRCRCMCGPALHQQMGASLSKIRPIAHQIVCLGQVHIRACCISGVLHIVQEPAEDDASVTTQLADVFNLMRPADSGRPTLTAADWGGVSAEDMATRMKVSCPQQGCGAGGLSVLVSDLASQWCYQFRADGGVAPRRTACAGWAFWQSNFYSRNGFNGLHVRARITT